MLLCRGLTRSQQKTTRPADTPGKAPAAGTLVGRNSKSTCAGGRVLEHTGWDDTQFADDSAAWHDYPAGEGHTVVGTIKVSQPLYGPAEGVRRRLLVYLPPSYSRMEKRYPVLYMH